VRTVGFPSLAFVEIIGLVTVATLLCERRLSLASYPGWDQPEVIDALRHGWPCAFGPGQLIIQEGAPADAFYLLIRGSVEVTQRRGDDVVRLARQGWRFLWRDGPARKRAAQ
jgi:hypothetical protein